MKIAVIRSEVSYTKGGAERYAANLCRELCERGHEVYAVAEICGGDVHDALKHVPVKVNRLSSARRTRSFHEGAQAAVRELKTELVIALSRSFPSDAFRVSDPLHRYWMKLRYPGRVQNFLQRLNPRHRTILEMEEGILDPENTRLIITNSELSKTLIREMYQYPAARIHVIYNGVDGEQFRPEGERGRGEALRLLFVGQDFVRKGLGVTLEAVARCVKAGVKLELRVVGRGDARPFREQAEGLGISEKVEFLGASREIQKHYQWGDLFVFPTRYDPFANVVLEAMSCGLPVLTTDTNGSSEVIEQGVEGYVTDEEAGDLVGQLARFIKAHAGLDEGELSQMRERVVEKAGRFSVAENAGRVLEVLTGK